MIDTLIAKLDLPLKTKVLRDEWSKEDPREWNEVSKWGILFNYSPKPRWGKIFLTVQFEFPSILELPSKEVWTRFPDAIAILNGRLKDICEDCVPPIERWKIDRVDFVHDFHLPGYDLTHFLRFLNRTTLAPSFVKDLCQNGETFYLSSKGERPNKIRLYCKGIEASKKGRKNAEAFRDVLRLEYQLVKESSTLERLMRRTFGGSVERPIRVADVLSPELAYEALEDAIRNLGVSRLAFGAKDARRVLQQPLTKNQKERLGIKGSHLSRTKYNTLIGNYCRCLIYTAESWTKEVGSGRARNFRRQLKVFGLWPPARKLVKVPLKLPQIEELTDDRIEKAEEAIWSCGNAPGRSEK